MSSAVVVLGMTDRESVSSLVCGCGDSARPHSIWAGTPSNGCHYSCTPHICVGVISRCEVSAPTCGSV